MSPLFLKAGQFQDRVDRTLNHGQSLFLLALRLYWGGRFFLAGYGKLGNIQGVAEFFASLGIPAPLLNAWAASLTECGGGLLLLLGVGSRLVSIPLIGTMIVALATAHRHETSAIFSTDPSTFLSALPVTYLMATLVVLFFGPGLYSVDALLARNRIPCGTHCNADPTTVLEPRPRPQM
jgi:putative oxidoreductase